MGERVLAQMLGLRRSSRCVAGRKVRKVRRTGEPGSRLTDRRPPHSLLPSFSPIPISPPWPSQWRSHSHDSVSPAPAAFIARRRLRSVSQSCRLLIPCTPLPKLCPSRSPSFAGVLPSNNHISLREYSPHATPQSALSWPCEPVSFHFPKQILTINYRPALEVVGDSRSQTSLQASFLAVLIQPSWSFGSDFPLADFRRFVTGNCAGLINPSVLELSRELTNLR